METIIEIMLAVALVAFVIFMGVSTYEIMTEGINNKVITVEVKQCSAMQK